MKTNRRINMRWILIAVVILLLLFQIYYIFLVPNQRRLRREERPAEAVKKTGMVASANRHASEAGIEILRKGGNAIDAAVSAAFALGVAEPFASGIGGGGFMLIYMAKDKQVTSVDYREMAPLRATPNMYLDGNGQVMGEEMEEGHRAVAVPGTVAGLTLALKQYGTMDLKTVMEPAIELAEKGYEVSKLLNSMMESHAQKLSKFPAASQIYLKTGNPYPVGDRIYLKDLANTYRLIAKKGPEVFYKGEIAEAIEKEMKRSGKGLITREDLAAYQPVLRTPVHGTYRGYEIFSMGPPSSGGTHVIELLNIFEGYHIAGLGVNSLESIILMAEAMKKIFSERAEFMGDPDFVRIPLDDLLSKEHAEKLRKEMNTGKMSKKSPSDHIVDEPHQTSHLSVVDNEGNLVALTQTINLFFGSGVVVPSTGILLNNEMNDFIPQPGSPDSIEARKRPVSSMSPTLMLYHGRPFLTIGMPGATRIITVLPQIIMNLIDHQMSIKDAIDAPRIHCMDGEKIFMESRIPMEVRNALTSKGYTLTLKNDFDLYFGGAQGVMIDIQTGRLRGGADPRREGFVMGLTPDE
jgi:gamma-glutamyltranspeptidase/glutathione hydrolase